EARIDYRRHRAGRVVPRRAAAAEGVRGPRGDAAVELVLDGPDRAPLPRPARRRPGADAPLRRPGRRLRADQPDPPGPAGRGLQPRRPEPRRRLVRDAGVHRRFGRDGQPAAAGSDPARRLADPVLPGRLVRDVRQGAGDAAAGDDALLPAQPLRRRQGLRPPHDRPVPRGARAVRLQRDPVQPRVAPARRHVRDPEGDARHRPDPDGAGQQAVHGQSRRPARLGLRQGVRRGDVADAPAGRAGRLRRGDRGDPQRPGAARCRVRLRRAGRGRLRRDRPALLPADRGGPAARRPGQGGARAGLGVPDVLPRAGPDHGRQRPPAGRR
ncbi:MAG: GDP-mannose 4,6-dehydratase, partial [uncultured Thermomicrobiales bacterium]